MARVIQQSQLERIATALVKTHTTFLETIESILNFAAAFETDYKVNVTDASAQDIVNDLQASDILQDYRPFALRLNRLFRTCYADKQRFALNGIAVEQGPAVIQDRWGHGHGQEGAV